MTQVWTGFRNWKWEHRLPAEMLLLYCTVLYTSSRLLVSPKMKILGLLALPIVFCAFVQQEQEECTPVDHEDCDDRCKLANFWFGSCTYYDGYSELMCKCSPYDYPLRADVVCATREHERCHAECQKNDTTSTVVGGYCYPTPSVTNPAGVAQCGCIKQRSEWKWFWNFIG